VFEVPDSPLPSQDAPPQPEALHVVLPPPGFICVAIGDIEGDNRKLHIILDYIEHHKTFRFIFLGDLVDDISDLAKDRDSRMACLGHMEPFFECHSQNSSDFRSLSFRSGVLNSNSLFQFIAGNSENDIVCDLRETPSPGEHPTMRDRQKGLVGKRGYN
jgi:hypothetical protein